MQKKGLTYYYRYVFSEIRELDNRDFVFASCATVGGNANLDGQNYVYLFLWNPLLQHERVSEE